MLPTKIMNKLIFFKKKKKPEREREKAVYPYSNFDLHIYAMIYDIIYQHRALKLQMQNGDTPATESIPR